MIKIFCEKIACKIKKRQSLTDEQKRQFQYGLEIFLLFLLELIILLGAARLLNIFWPVLIAGICFAFLRLNAGGFHFSTYLSCLFFSLVIFLFIGYITTYTNFSNIRPDFLFIWINLTFVLGVVNIKKYAPLKPEKISSELKENIIKQKQFFSLLTLSSWYIISLILLYFTNLNSILLAASLGIFFEIISLFPLGNFK